MVGDYGANISLSAGNGMILLCSFMVVYGLWKIFTVMYKFRRTEVDPIAFGRVFIDNRDSQKNSAELSKIDSDHHKADRTV